MKVFDDVPRCDKTRRAEDEPEFAFLNRTGSVFFEPVRDLFETWVAALPLEHRAWVIGQLRTGENDKFEGAFWELYPHQVVTGSGHEVRSSWRCARLGLPIERLVKTYPFAEIDQAIADMESGGVI